MNPARTATLLGAAIITVVAAIGSIDEWPVIAPFLRSMTLASWIVFALATSTDRIIDAITTLRHDVDTYGDQRQSDGYIDGMSHTVPQQPNLHRIR